MTTNVKSTLAMIATGCALVGVPLWLGATLWMLVTTWDPMVYAGVSTPALLGLAFAWLATYQGWGDSADSVPEPSEGAD